MVEPLVETQPQQLFREFAQSLAAVRRGECGQLVQHDGPFLEELQRDSVARRLVPDRGPLARASSSMGSDIIQGGSPLRKGKEPDEKVERQVSPPRARFRRTRPPTRSPPLDDGIPCPARRNRPRARAPSMRSLESARHPSPAHGACDCRPSLGGDQLAPDITEHTSALPIDLARRPMQNVARAAAEMSLPRRAPGWRPSWLAACGPRLGAVRPWPEASASPMSELAGAATQRAAAAKDTCGAAPRASRARRSRSRSRPTSGRPPRRAPGGSPSGSP